MDSPPFLIFKHIPFVLHLKMRFTHVVGQFKIGNWVSYRTK